MKEVGIVNWLSLDAHNFTEGYENLWSLLIEKQKKALAKLLVTGEEKLWAFKNVCKGKKVADDDFAYWKLDDGKRGQMATMVSLFRPDYFWTPYGDDGDETIYQYLMVFDENKKIRHLKFGGEQIPATHNYFQHKKRANYNEEVQVFKMWSYGVGSRRPVSWTVTPALVFDIEAEGCVLGPAHFGRSEWLLREEGNGDKIWLRSVIFKIMEGQKEGATMAGLYAYVKEVADFLGLKPTDIGIMGTELIWFVVLDESFNEGWMDFLREKCPKGWAAYREQCLEWWSSQQKEYALQSPLPKWAWSKP